MSKPASKPKGAKAAKGAKVILRMISKCYDITGAKIKCLNQTCPRCGKGVFLANHKDRRSCGKCSYTEIRK